MKDILPRSGYDLAAKILDTHPDDAIETMLRCGHGTESDWLEFKASMVLLPEDEKKGLKPTDLYWSYAKSIVAMINTYGGAFVIGVDDAHKPVPLSDNDPRHVIENESVDSYIRKEILDRISPLEPKPQTWTDKKGVSWSIERQRIASFVEPRQVTFCTETVVVLLVKPCELGQELFVIRTEKGNVAEQLPYRMHGDYGQVHTCFRHSEIEKYKKDRKLEDLRFASLLTQASPALFICHSSKDYNVADRLRQRLEERGITCWFAPNNIKGGNRWADSIVDAIDSSTAFLCLISRKSLKSSHVATEVKRAFDRKKKIIPVRIDSVPLSKTMEYYLSMYQIINAVGREDEAVEDVVRAVRGPDTLLGEPSSPSEPVLPSPPPSNHGCTRYDTLVSAFRAVVTPNSNGVRPIIDILQNSPMPTVETPTLGGRIWWDTLCELDGWKLQKNKFFNQIRILDDKNFRRAWGWRRSMERMLRGDRSSQILKAVIWILGGLVAVALLAAGCYILCSFLSSS